MTDVSQGQRTGRGKLLVVVLIVLALVGAGVAFALTRDDGAKTSTRSGQSSGARSETADLLAQAKRALIAPSDVGSGFVGTSAVTEEGSFPCNGKHYDDFAKPAGSEQVELDHGNDLTVVERIRVYESEDDAKDAFDAADPGYTCRNGTVTSSSGSYGVTVLSMATPFGSDGTDDDVAASLQVDSENTSASGSPSNLHQSSGAAPTASSVGKPIFYFFVFAARVDQTVIVVEYYGVPGADTTGQRPVLETVRGAIKKFTG